ncbi:MAG: GNAT family N-acetyltransferase [Hyphomicrobiaceae bacterium]
MFSTCPTIETERLRLRPFRNEDHPVFASFYADEATAGFLGGTCDAGAAWRLMAAYCGHWQLRGFGPFAVAAKSTDKMIGYCGPWFPHAKPERELIWGIVASHQRQGFASEAAVAARRWAYTHAGWPGAVSYIEPRNAASLGVARRLGATQDGTVTIRGYELNVMRHPSAEQVSVENAA